MKISLLLPIVFATCLLPWTATAHEKRPHIQIRGIYGGLPPEVAEGKTTLSALGVNAVWFGSGGVTRERVELVRAQGAKFYAEFNTLHVGTFLKEHPDAAPVGVDGLVSPPPEGWQGICPTHPAYRRFRMEAFRRLLADFEIDGVWLDYHHSHASWERAVPVMPDTCFCPNCLAKFQADTGIRLPDRPVPELASLLLGQHRATWITWRCDTFTDWVREFREILDATRPAALLGTFHAPWPESERNGALREKLAIDLKAQARYLDVFSPMPYHARFGYGRDPSRISSQVAWLGQHLGVEGRAGERLRIWPIVQLADWEEPVAVGQVATILEHGTRPPATGVTIFHARAFQTQPEKAAAMADYYRAIGRTTE